MGAFKLNRRKLLKTGLAGAALTTIPSLVRAEAESKLRFAPHADLASVDPVWTTADITRNFSLAVYDTLYGFDAEFNVQPQMAAGHTISTDGKQWEITLRDGLIFHDGSPVLARDCVATIERWGKRDAMGTALMARTDEIIAPSDQTIRFRLRTPFPLLSYALAQIYCAMMPERVARTDANTQLGEAIGSGPFKYVSAERVPGQRVVLEKNLDYVPRGNGKPSFNAGPKIVYFDRVLWDFLPDAATAAAALQSGEIDWWENPSIDLVPRLKADANLTVTVRDATGAIGCLRFNHLYAPFDKPAVRRVVLSAIKQKDVITAVAGAVPELMKTDVGLFVPGTPMASEVGVEITRGVKDIADIKHELAAAGYNGEKVVVLAPTTIPSIWAEASVATDVLQKIGMNIDVVALEWGAVVARRASKEPPDKGGWSVFFTNLGGFGNISPGPNIALRGSGGNSWFGWPTDPEMEALREEWFAAPDLTSQQKICREMQAHFWQNPSYVPLGMYNQPTAYLKNLVDVRDGWPQFYGVKRA